MTLHQIPPSKRKRSGKKSHLYCESFLRAWVKESNPPNREARIQRICAVVWKWEERGLPRCSGSWIQDSEDGVSSKVVTFYSLHRCPLHLGHAWYSGPHFQTVISQPNVTFFTLCIFTFSFLTKPTESFSTQRISPHHFSYKWLNLSSSK